MPQQEWGAASAVPHFRIGTPARLHAGFSSDLALPARPRRTCKPPGEPTGVIPEHTRFPPAKRRVYTCPCIRPHHPEARLTPHAAYHFADAGPGPVRNPLAPNLFIIGASKAGSSALHAYLAAHPDICMSTEKEPCFFVDQDELHAAWPIMARRPCSHGWEAYLDLWKDGADARYRGEGSVYYSQAPHRSGVAARIAAACPDARILYTVREPVTRAIGHYWQRFKEFQEPLPIAAAMRENPLYRDTSDYALQLQAYRGHFAPSQIHVIIAEELRADRRAVLARCIDWLGLAPFAFGEAQLADQHRSPPTSRRPRFPFVSRMRDSAAWAAARRHLSPRLIARLRQASTRSFDKKDVDETAARAYLAEYLAPRRAAFEAMIGRTIPTWDNV